MRRTDYDYIRTFAHHLIGVSSPSRGRAEPHARPSAAVTARLAVVWATVEDPALMAGSIPQKSPERIAAAKQLVSYGIEAWPSLDLLADIEVPLRCNRLLHRLVLRRAGTIEALSHPGLDIEAEQVAAAFGSVPLPCVLELDAGYGLCGKVVARGAPAAPLAASEHLRFVRLCRTWLAAGIPLASTGTALDEGLPWEVLAGHLEAGLSVEAAMGWQDTQPSEAARWADIGFAAKDRAAWIGQGRTLADARAATVIGGERVTRWAQVIGGAVSPEHVGLWAAWGEPTGVWGEVAARGLLPSELPAWLAAFTPVEVLAFVQHGIDLSEALRWKGRGYSAFVATGFLDRGISLDAAWELRRYPARQVQEAWPLARSVAGVMAALG